MNDIELADLTRILRDIAATGGSMHPLWDVVHDAEAILSRKPSWFPRPDVERFVVDEICKRFS